MHKKFRFVKLEKQRKLGKTMYSYKNNIKTYLKVKNGIEWLRTGIGGEPF